MLLVIRVLRGLEWEDAPDSDVVPERRGILTPNPMRVEVLDLVTLPFAPLQKLMWNLALAGIFGQPLRMRNRDAILTILAEHKQVISRRHAAPRGIIHDRFVCEVLRHRAVSNGKRFLPDRVAR